MLFLQISTGLTLHLILYSKITLLLRFTLASISLNTHTHAHTHLSSSLLDVLLSDTFYYIALTKLKKTIILFIFYPPPTLKSRFLEGKDFLPFCSSPVIDASPVIEELLGQDRYSINICGVNVPILSLTHGFIASYAMSSSNCS